MSANHEYLVAMMEAMSEDCAIYQGPSEAVYNGHALRVEYRWDEVKRCGWGQWFVDGVAKTYEEAIAGVI